jgi:hypothetical protein
MLSHLFNNIVITLFDTYVIQFTWAIPSSIHAFVKHKDFITYIIVSPILSNHFDLPSKLSNSYLTIHNPFAISLLSQKSKMLNQTLFKCMSCLILFELYGVFMLCYFCVIACTESYVLSWEKWKERDLQKGKWHTFFYLFYYCISVFQ